MHMHAKTDSEVTSLATSSPPAVSAAEAGVLRAESVVEGLARRREDGDDGFVPLDAGAEPGGIAAALSLVLLRSRTPLPRVFLQPILHRISKDLPRRRRREAPPQGPESIMFDSFVVQAGSDFTGVATEMITVNATVKLTFRNTATFFGVHVTSTPLDLSYDQITIGSGTIKKFYQSRKSQRTVAVSVMGNKIPLYGSGVMLSSSMGTTTTTTVQVPLKLNFVVRSKANVLGKLVKPKFYKRIECSIVFDKKKFNVPISLKNSCTYD
ncbi:hypothetical protein Acr_11g0002570 [Actinidia rufa]|uniref:Late embryogenesis abundant protein LEA-2 subgroup domain-containing protein n=1 Tax=Actinidia rufa TaxID=165716 RepID=A0A7J0FBA6_9ERIC|nr:hypothetical protein Acr_11g0002570 [Actinidia rufa]